MTTDHQNHNPTPPPLRDPLDYDTTTRVLARGVLFIGRFRLEEVLGRGGMGEISDPPATPPPD